MLIKIPVFIAKRIIKSRLDKAEKEKRIIFSRFDFLPKSIVVNEVMTRLEKYHQEKGVIDNFFPLYLLLPFSEKPEKSEDINRIAKILSWKEFRKYHQSNCSWMTRDVLKAVKNRKSDSEADLFVEDFKKYCKVSGKRFPDITKEVGGMSFSC